MKKAVIIVVAIVLLKPILPVFEYILNYDYIANVLCENKEQPEIQCNGKCHLMKELAKASEQEKPLSGKKSLHQETEVLFYQPLMALAFTNTIFPNKKQAAAAYSNLYSHLQAITFFHPPAFII